MDSNAEDPAQISITCTTEYPAYKHNNASKCWGLVTLKASACELEESKRPALDVVAVIDKSGSMKGEKLSLVKQSLKFLVQNLLKKDRLSVITYDSHVTVDFGLLSMNKSNKTFAESKIESIKYGSYTNLSGGLLQGLCTILDRGETKNDVASVLLFTDGLANRGIVHKERIIEAMKHPNNYLTKPRSQRFDLDMMLRYQSNSTPAVSCSSISSAASSGYQPMLSQPRSFHHQSSRNLVNYFSSSSSAAAAEKLPTQNLPKNENKEENAINVQQNMYVPLQASQIVKVQQPSQKPTQTTPGCVNVVEPNTVLQQPPQTPEQQAVPEEELQQSAQVVEPARPIVTIEDINEKKDAVDIDASVYTFGFGKDHDPDMLKAISDAAHGMYYFIENEEQISKSFGHCFGGLVSTLGQNIKLTLDLCDGVSLATVHTDQNYTSDDAMRKWEVWLGDMQSEEERDVLLTFDLPSTDSSTTTVLKSSIKYFCVIDSSYKYSEAAMSVGRCDDGAYSAEVASLSIDRQRNRVRTTQATKEALELADKGDLELARKRLKEEIKRVKESLTKDDELCKLLINDMEESLMGLQNRRAYASSGKKYSVNSLQMHSKQRSNRADRRSTSYETSSKVYNMYKFKV